MDRTTLDDEKLMTLVKGGDELALEVLYDRYSAAVMGLAFRILKDRAMAEEVMQETFWRAWSNADTFSDHRGSFSGWLFRIARNGALDKWRRRNVRPQPLLNENDGRAAERVVDPTINVPEAAGMAIKHMQVRAALSGLPTEQRRVIELAYFQGLTRQEIAAATGEPLGTVHTRARLALLKLKDLLRTQGVEE